MVFNGNYDVGMMPVTAASLVVGVGFIPVCGAIYRSHLIEE